VWGLLCAMQKMPSRSATRTRIPVPVLVSAVVVLIALVFAIVYLARRPAQTAVTQAQASPEAKAYLPNLQLSEVTMKAAENFMKQQVVEVDGKITNNGPRPLQSVSIYCLFSGVDGREVYRERVPIIPAKGTPLKPGETRSFRLPFDSLPDAWNQALPRMVIAQITFAG
jgi:archaellum component FlaF (FlaF/FlaG flagellin family)